MEFEKMGALKYWFFLTLTVLVCYGAGDRKSLLGDKEGDSNNSIELFEPLFQEAKSFYVDALIAGFFKDTLELKYCFDRVFEIIADISEFDTLTPFQQDEFNRFYEKVSYDFQTHFYYLNGDSGTLDVSVITKELGESILDKIEVGGDTLIVLDDRPGHLPIVTSKRIERIIEFFATKGHRHFQDWLNNAGRYRDHMVPILREYGLPEELFYLALIESGCNPFAYSYAHAAGPWQFIASTGALYGLKRNWWVDERRDPIKSTRSAAKYLRKLYDEFDDWFLALAAYNCGELKVWRAINREGTRDFWKLRTLPKQTQDYIPTLMAGIIIALNPEKYGFESSPKEKWEWEEVILDRSYELEAISKVSGIPTKTLRDFNPELRRWVSPPDVKEYTLRVPVGKSEGLLDKLSKLPPAVEEEKWISHKVRRGETLSYIARKYRTSVSAIVAANNIRNRNQIKVGQRLLIPSKDYDYKHYETKKIIHVVRKGETLSEIAGLYNVSLSKVRSWNNLYGQKYIYPGQKIVIYKSTSG